MATTTFQAAQIESSTAMEIESQSSSSSAKSAVSDFKKLSATEADPKNSFRRIGVPPHRYSALKASWVEICEPVVKQMKLQIRMNPKRRCIEIKTGPNTEETGAVQRAADYCKAFILGFPIRDAIALLRLDDLYIDSFEIKDVKTLQGEHLSRAIGRVAGQQGKTKFTIENATRTRIVLADTKVHILGSFRNIKVARQAIVRLIMGSPPGKVYSQMRLVANRLKNRY